MRSKYENEISIGDKLQPIVENVNNGYLGKYATLDEVINYFTEISYHLPGIYNVEVRDIDYWPNITFQSHKTGGFVFRIAGSTYEDKLEGIEFYADHYEYHDAFTFSRSYIAIDSVNKNQAYFKIMIQYIKAIMRNPIVAMYLNMKYPYNPNKLLEDRYFEEYGIKLATEYYNKFFYYKRKKQCFINHMDEVFIKNFYRIAKDYNNEIYKMAYHRERLNGNVVTIRSRAKLYYGTDNKYNQFAKEIIDRFRNDYYKMRDEIDRYAKENPDFRDFYSYPPLVVIDCIDNDNAYRPYWNLSLRQYIRKYSKVKHYYNDIVYPERDV